MSPDMLETILVEIKKEFPDFKIVYKTESKFMRFIDRCLRIISFGKLNEYMTKYTTTIGHTVYVSDLWNILSEGSKTVLLRHERVHMRQSKKLTRPLFSFLYLFIFFPAFFAYFRVKFEKEAYEESIRATAEIFGIQTISSQDYKIKMMAQFTDSPYLWMAFFNKSGIEKWFDSTVKKVLVETANSAQTTTPNK